MGRDFVVGLLFLVAIVGLGVLTLTVGDVRASAVRCRVNFDEVSGLRKGDLVRLRGAPVGEVSRILTPTVDGVEVEINLDPSVPLRAGGRFQVQSSSLLGGNHLNYEPGDGQAVSPEAHVFQGAGRIDLMTQLSEVIDEVREPLRESLEGLQQTIKDVNESRGLLGRLINEQEMGDRADNIVRQIEEFSIKINSGEGIVGKLVNDEELAASLDRIPSIIESLDAVAAKVSRGEGVLGALINDEEMADDLRQIFADVSERRGILGQLISDPELATKVRDAITHFDELMLAVREGEGPIPQLLSDPSMTSDLRDILANLADISDKVNTGNGTLAMLINDDALYRELQTTLETLQDLTEDAREQAPINAFLSPVFQAAF